MIRFVLLFLPVVLAACSACVDQDELVRLECRPGQQQVCTPAGEPVPSLDPLNPPIIPGQCKYGLRNCTVVGQWSECFGGIDKSEEICDGIDNDCDVLIDETYPEEHQLCGFVEGADYGVGICTPGVMTCDNGSVYCNGHVGPSDEVCDGLDNNCNGSTDEGIANSTAIVCYEGPEGTLAIGECRGGIRYCTDGGFDVPCDGQILPVMEVCDNKDNDCDGEIDEGFDNRGVDLVFVLDISGSFNEEIESMIQGIAPLLDDPITSTFRFGLVAVGTAGGGERRPPYMHSTMVSNFVPADEFLDILEAARMIQSAGIEPTIDTMFWTMKTYPFSWRPGAQKVIITMTDEIAQTILGKHCDEISRIAIEEGFELFVFALQPHHSTFLLCVHGENRRLYTPVSNSQVVFEQIRSIFEDLCIGGNR